MGKGHRDNHEARVKRGKVAFDKKKARRAAPKHPKCNVCGRPTRPQNLTGGICQNCFKG